MCWVGLGGVGWDGGQVESKKALQQLNEEKDALVAQLARRVEDLQALTKHFLIRHTLIAASSR